VTILVSHLTDMRFGPGQEHVWFGRVFFIVLMLAMFWIGRRWQDESPPSGAARSPAPQPRISFVDWAAVAFAIVVIPASLWYLATVTKRVESRLAVETAQLHLPGAAPGWSGPQQGSNTWRPLYSGARVELAGAYRDESQTDVDVYVGLYGIGTSGGAEMISYGNRIFEAEHKSLASRETRIVELPGAGKLAVREQLVREAGSERLVWYWFMVGDSVLTDPYAVKAHEALAFLTGGAVTERIVTLSTGATLDARGRLERFLSAHSACAGSGFSFEACGG